MDTLNWIWVYKAGRVLSIIGQLSSTVGSIEVAIGVKEWILWHIIVDTEGKSLPFGIHLRQSSAIKRSNFSV